MVLQGTRRAQNIKGRRFCRFLGEMGESSKYFDKGGLRP